MKAKEKEKKRSSGSDTPNFFREKNEQVQEMQKQELETTAWGVPAWGVPALFQWRVNGKEISKKFQLNGVF